MKTYLTYGLAMAVANALLTLGLYFAGLHNEAGKTGLAQGIGTIGGIAITVTCLVLGIRARRAEVPASEEFGYGRALGAGVMITLFASLFGMVTTFVYFGIINPGFADVLVEAELAKMEAKNLPPEALEGGEKAIRFMMKPPVMTIFGFIMGMVWGTLISLVTAAFLKRPAQADLPPAIA